MTTSQYDKNITKWPSLSHFDWTALALGKATLGQVDSFKSDAVMEGHKKVFLVPEKIDGYKLVLQKGTTC